MQRLSDTRKADATVAAWNAVVVCCSAVHSSAGFSRLTAALHTPGSALLSCVSLPCVPLSLSPICWCVGSLAAVVHLCFLLQVVSDWLLQHVPFKLLSRASVRLLAEVSLAAGCAAPYCVEAAWHAKWQEVSARQQHAAATTASKATANTPAACQCLRLLCCAARRV